MLSLQTGNDTAQHLFGSHADELAARNWAANLRALAETQPKIVVQLQSLRAGVTWIFGRDGSLTARTPDHQWISGCSVPLAAARAMLKKLDVSGVSACFLRPDHAAHLVAAIEKLLPEQALIAIVPDDAWLRVALGCADFSDAIDARRLWLVSGERWNERLDELFAEQPGLPTPSQFIRTPLLDETTMQELIVPAQDVFARHSARRNEQIRRLVSRGRPSDIARRRWCVVGASRFRLWQDAGAVLCDVISSEGGIFRRFDPGDPSASSPLALATTIDESDAVVSAGIGRADLPTVAGIEIPWITWVTNGQVPQRIDSARADAVILADARWRSAAEQKGWAAEQIFVAGWPALAVTSELAPTLSLIADTCRSATPDSDAMPLSSHRLMWEHVRDEIRADPFVLGVGMRAYLAERMRKFGIGSETLDQNRFIGQLVIPAYQQAVARVLVEGTIPIQIFGDGWHALEEFRAIARGPVRSRHDLLSAIGMSAALIHPLPTDDAHPIDAAPRPVIRPSGLGRQALIARARDAIKEFYPPARPSSPAIGCELIRTILRCI